MGEKSPAPDLKAYSRRDALRFFAAAVTVAGVRKLEDGLRLKPPTLEPEPFELTPDILSALRQIQMDEPIRLGINNQLLMGTNNGSFIQPDNKNVHRAGNGIPEIDNALKIGHVGVLDIDALEHKGEVWADHGFIPTVGVGGHKVGLPVVLDPNEWEIKLGRPKFKLENIVRYVGQHSNPDRPLGLSIEFKRGKFGEETMDWMFSILESNKIPAIIKTRNEREFELAANVLHRRNSSA